MGGRTILSGRLQGLHRLASKLNTIPSSQVQRHMAALLCFFPTHSITELHKVEQLEKNTYGTWRIAGF